MEVPDVIKCRGLILSMDNNKVVCPVPQKSISNKHIMQHYTEKACKYIISDFIDGTMINYFRFNDENYISTRSCIGAKCYWMSEKTFSEMFSECLEATNLQLDSLDMSYCYSFLIQHPNNTIVKKYQTPSLVLTHVSRVIDNTVQFLDVHSFVEDNNITIRVPSTYTFEAIEDVCQHVASLPESDQGVMIFEKDAENPGFILDMSRTKIRNIKYNQIRSLRGNTNNKHYLFFTLRKSAGGSFEQYIKYFEEDKVLFESYRLELYAFTSELFKAYLDCFVNKNSDGTSVQIHKDIAYELKPLVAELHAIHMEYRNPTTKDTVIQYLYNLPIPRLMFALNKRRVRINTD